MAIFLLGGIAGSTLLHAQGDFETVKRSMELLEKMEEFESELRAETDKKIANKRERAIEDLEKLVERYLTSGEVPEASLIMIEMNKLRAMNAEEVVDKPKVDGGDGRGQANKESSGNQYFKYGTDYLFEEKGVISGKLIFRPNLKVRAVYKYKGQDVVNTWEWEDKKDHVEIKTGGALGKIIISERPSSNFKSLLIRWGGELTNILTDAEAGDKSNSN